MTSRPGSEPHAANRRRTMPAEAQGLPTFIASAPRSSVSDAFPSELRPLCGLVDAAREACGAEKGP